MFIHRSVCFFSLLATSCLAGGFDCRATESPDTEPPNVVLVMADDQGWGDVGYNGHPHLKTANLDRAATNGLRFDRFYAAAPVCSPTRASVLTGRHPNRMGCFKWGNTIRPQEVTIAEVLQNAGYATGHFGKWHVGSVRRGSPVNPGASGFDRWLSAPNFFDNDPHLSREGTAVACQGESSQVTVDAAIEFIQDCTSREQKFFCVVWFGSPHGPHRALDEDRRLYAEHAEPLQHFYGELTAMDRAFGNLVSKLAEFGVTQNTLLWYTSDNGALRKVGSPGKFRGRKGSVYEGGLLVPAFIQWPQRVTQARQTMFRCNSTDIFPTLVEVCGANQDHEMPMDGVSLGQLIDGRVTQRQRPMGFWDYPSRGISTPSEKWMKELLSAQQQGGEPSDQSKLRLDAGRITKKFPSEDVSGHAAWIDGDWKLHRIKNKNTGQVRMELYDLKNDPSEAQDRANDFSRRRQQMEQSLLQWQESVINSLNGADY